jgi:uncharacterized membrane protein YGL010W
MASARLKAYFDDYAGSHATRGNQLTHMAGIPLIMWSLLGLLDAVALGPVTGGQLLLAGAIVWYLTLDLVLAIGFAVIGALCYFTAREVPHSWLWAAFVAGWILQGIGHYVYEKKSPAFFQNLKHLLIGPLWIFAKLIGRG